MGNCIPKSTSAKIENVKANYNKPNCSQRSDARIALVMEKKQRIFDTLLKDKRIPEGPLKMFQEVRGSASGTLSSCNFFLF